MTDTIASGPDDRASSAVDLDAYLSSIDRIVTSEQKKIESVTDYSQRRFAKDRSYIVYIVVGVWAIVILMHIYFVASSFPEITCTEGSDCDAMITAWREPAKFILDTITQLVLPIVTLVIGYYFGTQKNENGDQ